MGFHTCGDAPMNISNSFCFILTICEPVKTSYEFCNFVNPLTLPLHKHCLGQFVCSPDNLRTAANSSYGRAPSPNDAQGILSLERDTNTGDTTNSNGNSRLRMSVAEAP